MLPCAAQFDTIASRVGAWRSRLARSKLGAIGRAPIGGAGACSRDSSDRASCPISFGSGRTKTTTDHAGHDQHRQQQPGQRERFASPRPGATASASADQQRADHQARERAERDVTQRLRPQLRREHVGDADAELVSGAHAHPEDQQAAEQQRERCAGSSRSRPRPRRPAPARGREECRACGRSGR